MNQTITERVEALLAEMTLAEKVGQMYQGNARSDDTEKWVRDWCCGSLLQTSGEGMIRLQKIASEETRLGIPLIFGIDAIHGHNQWKDGTVFPSQLALANSWNPELARTMGHITAKEMTYTGIHWTFSPACELVRDARWGRCDEAFGEDTFLAAEFVAALTQGYQGDDLSEPHSVLACLKHFAGYCETQGGRDSSEGDLSKRKLLNYFLPVFEKSVKAGAGSVMIGYNAIDGEPCNTNKWLLNDILKDEWGLDGFTITDWANVTSLINKQYTCHDFEEASIKSVKAGMDMAMTTPEFVPAAIKAVESGKLDISCIDKAVRRILGIKFRLGLFEAKRYPDMEAGKKVWFCQEHQDAALQAGRESLVLLKNDNTILPLGSKPQNILLCGQNANDDYAMMGDWSRVGWNTFEREPGETGTGHPRENIVLLTDGLKAHANVELSYIRGCGPLDAPDDTSDFAAAAEAAKEADTVIIAVGDERQIMGENFDMSTLDLPGNQQAFIEHMQAVHDRIVLVLINSKPYSITWAAENVPAIIEAFNPGIRGGTAMADAIMGTAEFVGKLAVSFPRTVGQIPVYYNQLPGWHSVKHDEFRYVDNQEGPLYPFGFGLSYTSFTVENIKLSAAEIKPGDTVTVTADVTNTGEREGREVVQLYIRDRVSELTRPIKELKGYALASPKPGETVLVTIELAYDDLAYIGRDLQKVVEPGLFDIMVGRSSDDADLTNLELRASS